MAGEKVGRNDPCPCGSGRKYKQCCLGKAAGEGDALPSVADDLRGVLKDRGFSTLDELQAEADSITRQRNNAALAEFHGLSPAQMYRILYFPFDSAPLVTFADPLPAEPQAPIVGLLALLVEGIGESGVKATAKGNLPRNLCREVALRHLGESGYAQQTRYAGINKEEDFHDLHVTRMVAELAGLIRKYRGRFVLTRKCGDLLASGGMAAVYPVLMRAFVEKYNWGYGDAHPELAFIQHSFLFSLYLLSRYGHEGRQESFYVDNYLRAFPSVLDELEERPYATVRDRLGWCYRLRVFDRFMAFFGLAAMASKEGAKPFSAERTITALPLLDSVVRFDPGQPAPAMGG